MSISSCHNARTYQSPSGDKGRLELHCSECFEVCEERDPNIIDCERCEGKGFGLFSCCTGEPVDPDIARCPKCKENIGEETCEDCKGEGTINKNDNE